MKMSAEEYGRRVRRVGPPSPLGGDCLWAFGVGGGICLLGEVLRGWYLTMGLDKELAGTLTSCTLVALSALLTTLGLYQNAPGGVENTNRDFCARETLAIRHHYAFRAGVQIVHGRYPTSYVVPVETLRHAG